jgi:hypothetical protein
MELKYDFVPCVLSFTFPQQGIGVYWQQPEKPLITTDTESIMNPIRKSFNCNVMFRNDDRPLKTSRILSSKYHLCFAEMRRDFSLVSVSVNMVIQS